MNNTLHYIEEYKTFEWQLNDYLGNIFEREIFQIINKQISGKFDDGVRIYQTPTGPDGGKDIIIRSTVPVCILNQSFELDFKDEITIYIECKSSDKKRIDLTKVAGSLMRVKENNIDYYVLISNSSFAPQTLHILKTDFEAAGIKFKVIDQYFLLKALENESFFNSKSIIVENKLYYEYQVSTTRVDNKNAYELFFTYRNLWRDFLNFPYFTGFPAP
ncbi:MAG: restriction endonuclease [Roseburia sp.]|nr:restriction endonuclease [Roseburia sp.]